MAPFKSSFGQLMGCVQVKVTRMRRLLRMRMMKMRKMRKMMAQTTVTSCSMWRRRPVISM